MSESISETTYDDLLKEELYLLNDDVNSQNYVAQCLLMIGIPPMEAVELIETVENVGRAKIKEAYYFMLVKYKELFDELNLKTEIV